ncbi:MAG: DUF5655 domain-containing protein [Actinobacteria bacterium]|nr:DUF5655 domain-containing protein [Actinomycetota bacterium]MCI0678546.1 DUF5655 domain-containing protein [Actinomycetota bacterium]
MSEVGHHLWTCDRCGRSFAARNQAHNCVTLTLAEHLVDKTENSVAIYHKVVDVLRRHGEVREHAQKGGIGFITKMTFAGVALKQRWVDLHFILPRPLDHPRVRKLDLHGPTTWVHTIRLSSPADVDHEIETWLAASYRRGMQETLDPRARIDPLTPSQIHILWTGFRGRCGRVDDTLVVRLPRYVADALGRAETMNVRLGGVRYMAPLLRVEDSTVIEVDPGTGLGDGDESDVFLTGPGRTTAPGGVSGSPGVSDERRFLPGHLP